MTTDDPTSRRGELASSWRCVATVATGDWPGWFPWFELLRAHAPPRIGSPSPDSGLRSRGGACCIVGSGGGTSAPAPACKQSQGHHPRPVPRCSPTQLPRHLHLHRPRRCVCRAMLRAVRSLSFVSLLRPLSCRQEEEGARCWMGLSALLLGIGGPTFRAHQSGNPPFCPA